MSNLNQHQFKSFEPDEAVPHGKGGEYELSWEHKGYLGESAVTAFHNPTHKEAGRLKWDTASMGHEGLITDLSVDKEHRGRGLKKAMLKHARNVADVGADYHPYR